MPTPPDPATFEAFYQDVRGRLLLQTWALTGDLAAAQKAVRDSLVIAWHHWRKLALLEDPQRVVRPLAWTRAQRRAAARPFHKERRFDDGIRATLNALQKLSLSQRRVLLLAHLTTLPLDELAREVGLPLTRAERELGEATARFAHERGIAATEVLAIFEPLAVELREIGWPRTSVLTRAGTGRRRLHTLIGAAVAVAAFVGAGVVATDSGGAKPSLNALTWTTPTEPEAATRYPLATGDLLSEGIVTNELKGRWTNDLTSDNSSGSGLVLPCQRERFADRSAQAGLLRTLSDADGRSVSQVVEASLDPARAHATWVSSVTWYAGCTEPRFQLVSTRNVSGVGDEARLVVLRDWNAPERTLVASVARTGILTTTVISAQPPKAERPVADNTDLLKLAVTKLCALPGAGRCTAEVATTPIGPLGVGKAPAMLGTMDLPPVAGVAKPWDATDPATATVNQAATRCDATSFHGKGITGDLTRSFLIPAATNLSAKFGLTETIGSWASTKAATKVVTSVRTKIADCSQRDLGTKVAPLASSSSKRSDLAAWRVTMEISDESSVVYLMAVVRSGAHVAQLGFVPDGSKTITDADFLALAKRAAERLALPG